VGLAESPLDEHATSPSVSVPASMTRTNIPCGVEGRRYGRRMRRLVTLGAMAGIACALVVTVATPAGAHLCATGAQIPVGTSTPLVLVITVEQLPIPDVELTLPPEVRIDGDPAPPAGWAVTRNGQTLRYHGGPFAPITCPSFTVNATATKKGAYSVEVVQRDAHGTIVSTSTNDPRQRLTPFFSPVVYAGVKIPSPSSGGGGVSFVTIAGIVLVGAGVVLVLGLATRSWRDRRALAREDELQDRVEEFKKQARDRR
jgi:hypothetical protein